MEQLEPRRLLSASPVPEPVDSAGSGSSRILVQLVDNADPQSLAASLTTPASGWETSGEAYATPGLFSMELPAHEDMQSAIDALRASPLVAFAEPDYPIRLTESSHLIPADPQFESLYGLHNTGQTAGTFDADIDAPEAWNVTTGSYSTIIAVIDSGVDYTHEDLVGNLWQNGAEIPGNNIDDDGNGYVDDFHGFDFYDDDGDPMDEHGHGTHVAGTIGAVGGNGLGITGVNHQVQIMPLRFLGPDGSGYISDAISALEYAVANGALISNNSWGGGVFSQAMFSALEHARDAGHIFVAAAGNSSLDHDTVNSYPASYPIDNVVSVAATDHHDELTYFSDFGQATVDVAAPGLDILSTTPGNTYSYFSGTSMAAPHAAGVLGLMQSAHPEWTAQQLIHQLTVSSDPVSALETLTRSGGRINAAASLDPSFQSRASLNFDQNVYETGTTVTVRLVDFDLIDVSTFNAVIHSSGGDSESVEFSSVEPGIFEARISTVSESADADGVLGVSAGDVISISFLDLDDGTGQSRQIEATARILSDDHGNDAATATPCAINTSPFGEIEQGGDADWFSFSVTAGHEYEFSTDLLTLSDSTLTLYDQDGETQLAFNDDGGPGLASRINWTASQNGTLFLKVAAYSSSQTGSYTLNLNAADSTPVPSDDHGNDAATASPVAMNSSTEGDIETSFDSDWFQFPAVAGENYVFETHLGSLPDSWLELYDQDGQTLLAFDDDGGDGLASRIEWTAIDTGTYFLNVEGYDLAQDTGTYTLDVQISDSTPVPSDDHGNDAATASPVAMNSSTEGEIETSFDSDWFQFPAVAGENYVFETHLGSLPDSWLELYDQDGQTLLTFNDDGGDGLASRIEWTAIDTGTYFLNVEGYDLAQDTGTYTLDVVSVDTTPGPTDLIDVSVEFTDLQGQPLDSLLVGQTFEIAVVASDLRDGEDWEGVLAAFADVVYDSELIDVLSIHHVFDDFTFGALTDGEVDDAGGLELDAPVNPGSQTVFTLTATATQPGNLQVDTNVAENLLAENLLFGTDGDLREQTRYGSGSISIQGELTLEVSTDEIAENAGAGASTATVSRSDSGDLSQSLVVMLSSSDTSEATVPESVVIPAGQTSVSFQIDAVDDNELDGTQTVTITATATNYLSETATLDVTDFELADLVANRFDVLDDHLLGGVATVQVEIVNQGTGMAAPFAASIVLSEDDIIGNDDDITIGTLDFAEGLQPGEVYTHEFETTDLRSLLYEQALNHDAPGLGIGYLSANVIHLGLHIDSAGDVTDSSESNNTSADNITYFPWDTDGNGTVTPADVGYIVNRLGSADSIADMDGNGNVTPTEVVAALNRIGYVRNESVVDAVESDNHLEPTSPLTMAGLNVVSPTEEAEPATISESAMGIRVSLTDPSGIPVQTLRAGQSFQIHMLAEDLRDADEQTSVVSAYADVLFDPDSVEISDISHIFELFPSAEIVPEAGVVSGVGGLQVNVANPAAGPQVVAILTAKARSNGPFTIRTRVPQDSALQNTLYLNDADVREVTRYGIATGFVLPEIAHFDDGRLTLSMSDGSTNELYVQVDDQQTVEFQTVDGPVTTGIPAQDVTSITISGTTQNDVIDLGGVTLAAFSSLTLINVDGQAGDDRITMPRREFIPAQLSGGDGHDTLEGGASHDALDGGAGDDFIAGNGGDDSLAGHGGSDTLMGRTGNDLIHGGNGADVLLGNTGQDTVYGEAGDDVIRGHAGRDLLVAGSGTDRIYGGPGADWLGGDSDHDSFSAGAGNDTISSSTDSDQFISPADNSRSAGVADERTVAETLSDGKLNSGHRSQSIPRHLEFDSRLPTFDKSLPLDRATVAIAPENDINGSVEKSVPFQNEPAQIAVETSDPAGAAHNEIDQSYLLFSTWADVL